MKPHAVFRSAVVSALSLLLLAGASASSKPRKSPFVEIVGEGIVTSAPRETTHKNGRKFLEFEMTISAARPSSDQPKGADPSLEIDRKGRIRVVHDLSCGGAAVTLALGDHVEFAGEYVHVPKGGDLIHFTHPADANGSCGSGGKHPGGYLRKVAAPRPASLVPEQPYFGTPRPVAKPYRAILEAKEKGASDADLLAKVESEKVVYSLTTYEMQELRAAGVSPAVIEAMLRSGRGVTPGPATPVPR